MKALFFWIFILVGLAGTARRVLNIFKLSFQSGLEECVLSVGLGLGAMSYLVFLVGSLGFLYAQVFVAILAGLFLVGMEPCRRMVPAASKEALSFWKESPFWNRALIILIFLVFGFSLCGSLAPAIGQDELCYHLMQPKNYVRAHAVYEVAFSSNSLWPYLMHMLFTLGLLLEGDSLAKLFHFTTYLFAGLAIFSFLKREAQAKTALYGLAVYALTPVAFIQASFAYVDNALSFYIFAAFYAFYLFVKEKKAGWAVLSGIFAGYAAAVKLIGLFVLPILFLTAIPYFLKSERKKNFLTAASFFATAFLISGGLWYARSWILRENPVYPFYPEFFGGHGWKDPTYLIHGGARGWLDFISLPWNLTMHPELFGGEHIGLLYLAILPLLLIARPWPAWLRSVLFFGAGYTVLWFKVDPNIRFFLPGLAFFACAAGFWISSALEEPGKPRRFLAGILCGMMFLVQSAFAAYHFKDSFLLLFHRNRARYLHAKERSYFAAQTINRFLKPSDRILSVGEIRGYYFDNPFVLDADFKPMSGYADKVHSGRELADYLKARGFTHALNTDIMPGLNPLDPPFCLDRFLKEARDRGDFFKEALRIQSGKTRYVLYEIT